MTTRGIAPLVEALDTHGDALVNAGPMTQAVPTRCAIVARL
jgi:hypothetical protein